MYQAIKTERSLSEAELDDDGDVKMKEIPLPIFQAVSAPMLTRTEREFLVKWKKARTQYERLVRSNEGVTAVSVRDSTKPSVLESLVDWVLDCDTEDDVTDELLWAFIDKQCEDGAVDGNAGAIPQISADMEMDLEVKDPHSCCLKIFHECKERSKRAGLLNYLSKNGKEHVKVLVDAIRPFDLQFRVK
jgi:hypothetical protein